MASIFWTHCLMCSGIAIPTSKQIKKSKSTFYIRMCSVLHKYILKIVFHFDYNYLLLSFVVVLVRTFSWQETYVKSHWTVVSMTSVRTAEPVVSMVRAYTVSARLVLLESFARLSPLVAAHRLHARMVESAFQRAISTAANARMGSLAPDVKRSSTCVKVTHVGIMELVSANQAAEASLASANHHTKESSASSATSHRVSSRRA